MSTAVRLPAVAGRFYPADPRELQRQLDALVPDATGTHELLACVSPHAGYVYSGSVAGELFGHLDLPRRIIVLGPNHTGLGARIAVASHRGWQTPLGEVEIDGGLAGLVTETVADAELDAIAHQREHSIEVQLPFLRKRRPDVTVLPICLANLDLDSCLELGRALAAIIGDLDEPVGLVASSDMSHFEPDAETRVRDRVAIDAMLRRDPRELYETVRQQRISMCGMIPATVAIEVANRLGAGDAHLVRYATSGDVNDDRTSVVGYAGLCVHRGA